VGFSSAGGDIADRVAPGEQVFEFLKAGGFNKPPLIGEMVLHHDLGRSVEPLN
jgi:hypothetical protein